jgi:predicted ATP-grasp superfamily ATP-dependent carboligase
MALNRFKTEQPEAVVLGLGILGLGIVRSLGTRGVEVCGVYSDKGEIGRFSRYCQPIQLPNLRKAEEEYLQTLIEKLGNPDEKPILFGESDEHIMFMSRNRDRLHPYFCFMLPDVEILGHLVKKHFAGSYVIERGLRIPETHIPREESRIEQLLSQVKYPCIVKPIDSFSVNFSSKSRKNLTFSDADSLFEFLQDHKELLGQIIIQDIIPGGDSNTYQATTYVKEDFTVSYVFTMRKIRQCPPNYGSTSFGVSERIPALAQIAEEFLRTIQYRGFISMEFKYHPLTGEWMYIESNPRLPLYHALIHDSGVNYPYIYYQDLVGQVPDSKKDFSQKDGVLWIHLKRDLESYVKRGALREQGIGPWLSSVYQAKSFAIPNRNDMKPFIFNTILYLKDLLLRSTKKVFFINKERVTKP